MSLNNIQLGAQQLVQLYGELLVETEAGEAAMQYQEPQPPEQIMPEQAPVGAAAPVMEEKPAIRSLGGNAKGVLVLVQKEKEAFLPESELNFLTTILAACGLSLADIALVNLHAVDNKSYGPLTEQLNSRQVLLFDVQPGQLGMPINFPPFQVQAFKGLKYLHAPALHLIEADLTQKKSLWNALKNLFGI